ncbi:MAG TPA: amidohydrolase family protein [Actinomycetota bacterium]|nr:amidohydrolase family protein [Actinomycetota bacterium]
MTSSRAVIITGASVLEGPELRLIDDAVIVVRDGVIETVGRAGTEEPPSGAEEMAAPDSVVVPGFVDMHVHIGLATPSDVLAGGVTTVLDLGWPPDLLAPVLEQSRTPGFEGPLVLAAGPILTAQRGYPTRARWAPPDTGREVASAHEARASVNELVEGGATVVKIALDPTAGPTLELDVVREIASASHDRGVKVMAHISSLAELDKAIAAGVDALAHMLLSPDRIPDETIEEMVSRDVAVVPTLSVFTGPALDIGIDNLHRFRGAGGVVLYGTDLGNEGPMPGIDPLEVAALQAAGMGTLDIIRAATVTPSSWLPIVKKGWLAAGMDADLVAVSRDALDNPALLCRPRLVMREGVARR